MFGQSDVFVDDRLAPVEEPLARGEEDETVPVGKLGIEFEHHLIVPGLDEAAMELQASGR